MGPHQPTRKARTAEGRPSPSAAGLDAGANSPAAVAPDNRRGEPEAGENRVRRRSRPASGPIHVNPERPHRAAPAAPDTGWLFDRLEHLCARDTTTGSEDAGLDAVRELLAEQGANVELQEVEPGRHNVLATWGAPPRILFSTHLDTVPPYLPPRRDGDTLHGRGTCDAKGQIVAQLAAIAELRRRGRNDVAWLGVVGEETDSVGARAAPELRDRLGGCRVLINGEPTENRLATGQRGSLQLRLGTSGVPCHSGTPELGRSAIWPLLEWLQRMRAIPAAEHPQLGREIWNLGLLRGGEAPNVVPAAAEAILFVRSLPGTTFAAKARALMPECGTLEELKHTPPDLFDEVPGFPRALVTFGSDAPRLRQLVPGGAVALVGPGSIKVAHTEHEHITGADLRAGVALLLQLADALAPEEA